MTGDPAYLEAAGHRVEAINGQVTVTSSSSGPEVVDVATGAAAISVATSNPDAVVCVHPNNSPGADASTVTLTASAQLRAVVVDRYNLALDVATGFAPPSGTPLVHLRGPDNPTFDELDPSLQTHAALVRIYTRAQWEARRLSSGIVSISALPNSFHHSAVVRLDATASTVLEVIELPGVSLQSIEPVVSSAP